MHEKKEETVRPFDMEKSGIRIAVYWTEVLPKAQLERKLHESSAFCARTVAGDTADRADWQSEV